MNYASGSASMAIPKSQMVTGPTDMFEQKQYSIYEIEKLSKEAERMGLTPEIRDLVEAHKECQKKLQEKAIKLGLLEAFAMESMDENVVELRNQLFTVITLLYSDKIDEMMREQITQESSAVEFDSDINKVFDDRGDVKEDCPKYDIVSRMKGYLIKRRRYKSQLASLKKKAKNNAGL